VKIGDGPLLFAASLAEDPRTVSAEGRPCAFFNGSIARPTIATLDGTNPVTLADWDSSLEPGGDMVYDVSGRNHHGKLVNAPTRAVKSHDYDYSTVDWTKASAGYGAIHFHEDDLDDAEWETDFTITVPKGRVCRRVDNVVVVGCGGQGSGALLRKTHSRDSSQRRQSRSRTAHFHLPGVRE
jgi:hypothetical protein